MRGDAMQWIGRLVAVVFGAGVLALTVLVVSLVRRAEGVPPMPIFMGILGMVALILVAGACLALISLAVSARQALALLRAQPVLTRGPEEAAQATTEAVSPSEPTAHATETAEIQGPFSPTTLREASARPARPGRRLVAER